MKTSIIVQNLKCGGCANTISTKLSDIKNISDIKVHVDESKVSFNYINEADALAVKEKLKNIGYPSVEDDNNLVSKAKSFVSCATGKFSK
ncbi:MULTISPECIES: heavy-metal-associated domain-containing protein [unclassified Algibacter]|uniref:heavy-metal-associated domain-containing protein n=1 Tax=unclassified Algibacter TaxID=2615009 RepID=UPI00131B2959|nr:MULTISPECIES: heavy metal-associated domain-containing protein [unclassified Algibacter]MCL5128284.1 heavy-metal-associated domain-containing protein [Algibacter sp. L4_22]